MIAISELNGLGVILFVVESAKINTMKDKKVYFIARPYFGINLSIQDTLIVPYLYGVYFSSVYFQNNLARGIYDL